MLQYVVAGLALGSIYAIASAGLVVTFESAGILNFAFGSMAYVVARFYYWLNSQHGWPTYSAGLVSLLVLAPLMGVVLYAGLFRFLRHQPTLIKLVATIGLSVALPPVADLLMGTQTIDTAPGLALPSDHPFHIFGTPVTTDQVITYAFLIFVVTAGTAVLRLTRAGLRVRAVVDSQAMASLSGTHPGRVALGAWAVSATLAGLAGILVAPSNGLSAAGMTALMAAAFAAVIVARLRSLPGAVAVSLGMGVVTDVIQKYLPPDSSFTAALIPSIPFGVILLFLLLYLVRSGSVREAAATGGPLDHAIRPGHEDHAGATLASTGRGRGAALGLIPLAAVGAMPLIFRGSAYWLGLVALGGCYAVTFLTFTVVTGEGGMLWLSQIIFAGAGALAAGQFVSVWHVPVLLAIVFGGVIAAAAGAVIGLLTIRLGELYVGLVTLTFGLLAETLIFTRNRFLQGGLGIHLDRPHFAEGDLAFSYLTLGVFVAFALLILNLRYSTTGLALRAVRDSEPAARTLGLSVLQVKVIVGALAAFVAAVGGGFIALDARAAQPQSYETFAGLIWLAVVVTMGVRSITAAALAGMSFALFPGLVQTYLPARWGEVPAVLFGLGAVLVARHPEGAVLQNARQLRVLVSRRAAGRHGPEAAPGPGPTGVGAGGDVLSTPARLACTGVTVRFGGLTALRDVNLEVPPSAIVGLVGPNGAGKSTLFGALSGLVRPSDGHVFIDGQDVTSARPQRRAALGLARTFQHPELFAGLTVEEHLVLAHRARHAGRRVWLDLFTVGSLHRAAGEERAEVGRLISLLGLEDLAPLPAAGLPLGVARLVELGRALASSPSVLLLDEPSSGLDSAGTALFEVTLRRVAEERGLSVLLVEHDVDLVMRLCQKVYVLDFGVLIGSGTPAEVRADRAVQAAYLGETLTEEGRAGTAAPTPTGAVPAARGAATPDPNGSAPLLAVERLGVRYGGATALTDISFSLVAGRALAVLGANGAGKSSLARAVSGLVRPAAGRVILAGEDVTTWSPHRIRRAGLVHLPEGRGVFRELSVMDNLRMAAGLLDDAAARREAVELALEIFPALAARRRLAARSLSGGEQQMLSLARALATAPRLLVADEMSLGLAPVLVDLVFEGLGRAREAGVTLVMIEQYVHRALAFADECLVLEHGRVAWSGPAADAGNEVLRHYLGDAMVVG